MRKLRRVNIERSEEIFEKIGKYVDAIVAKLNPHKIILFGSFARGDFNEASDVDILVISDFHESFLERSKTLTKYNDFGLPLEPVGYTPQEFEEMGKHGNRFAQEILRSGKILYSRQQI